MSFPTIRSRQNQRIKDAVKLRIRRQRTKQQRILIDGTREIDRAVAANVRIAELFYCSHPLKSTDGPTLAVQMLVEKIADTGAEVSHVTPDVFAKLAFGDRSDGMVAVAQTPNRRLQTIDLRPNRLVAVLDRVEKPGNIGAIARSADAADIAGLILSDGRTDLFNPNAIRASVGTVFSTRIAEATADETVAWLHKNNLPVFIARPEAERLYTGVDFSAGGAIVLGNEADGASDRWSGDPVTPIRLPMHGTADSLNVSVAAAILFYEALRQRDATTNGRPARS